MLLSLLSSLSLESVLLPLSLLSLLLPLLLSLSLLLSEDDEDEEDAELALVRGAVFPSSHEKKKKISANDQTRIINHKI